VNDLGVELLIYIYLAVCLAMILFNIGTIIFAKHRERVNEKRGREFRILIQNELDKAQRGEKMSRRQLSRLKLRLRNPEQLLVFIQVLLSRYEQDPDSTRLFIRSVSDVLIELAPHYEHNRDPIRYAFYLYILKELGIMGGVTQPEAGQILLKALRVPNTYCRENALQAIYLSGNTGLVLLALEILDSEHIAHNRKLLSDGLLTFTGDKEELIDTLWDHFESFELNMQVVILDYIRFGSSGHRDQMFAILTDETRSAELRFSCIRYFGKYPDREAYPVLLEMASDLGNLRWEYPAIACTALASYPGETTVNTLKRALHVANWYVRYNAADSLAKLGVGYMDLIEIIDGNDRYAREILQFQLDMQYNQRKKALAE